MGDFLQSIHKGVQLKKTVVQAKKRNVAEAGGNDVAAILARRIALEVSDSDDGQLI
jgi:hypothetical protein